MEVDLIIDLGAHRIPVEIKSGETVAGDFFDNLDRYIRLSRDPGGILVYGGNKSYMRRAHGVRAWWTCS